MKKFLAAILTATMVLGLAACGGNAQTGGSGSTGTGDNTGAVTIKLGHGQTEAHPYHLGAAKFASWWRNTPMELLRLRFIPMPPLVLSVTW